MVPPDSGSVPLVRLGGARGGAWPSARVRGSASAEPKWSDAFVELVAWFWTEGWAGSGGQVTITQSEKANPGHCARIRAALTAAFGPDAATRGVSLLGARGWEGRARIREALAADPALSNYAIARACGVDDHTVALVRRGKEDGPSWSQACEARGIVRFRLNAQAGRLLVACAPDKVVDTGFLAELTPAQLDLFIRVSLDADGSRNNTGTWVMAQKDRHRVEAFQIACAGRVVWRRPRPDPVGHVVHGRPGVAVALAVRAAAVHRPQDDRRPGVVPDDTERDVVRAP